MTTIPRWLRWLVSPDPRPERATPPQPGTDPADLNTREWLRTLPDAAAVPTSPRHARRKH